MSSPTAANSASSALTGLTFDDVRAATADEDWNKDTAQAEFRLFDGTVITIRGRAVDDKHWIRVTSTFDPALNERFVQPKKDDAAATPAPATTTKDAPPKPATPAATKPSEPVKTAAEIRTESEALAKRTESWAYSIPGFKYDTIFRPLDQLLQPLPTKPAKDKKP